MSSETDELDSYLKEADEEGQLLREMDAQRSYNESLPTTELLRVTTDLIDQVVDVYVKDGSVYSGLFYSIEKDGAVLRKARLTEKGTDHSNVEDKVVDKLEVSTDDLVKIVSKRVTLTLDGVDWNITVAQDDSCSNEVQKIEQEEQKIEQEEQPPPREIIPISECKKLITPSSGQLQQTIPSSDQGQQTIPYSDQGQQAILYRGQCQPTIPYRGQGQPNYPYPCQWQQGFPYSGQEQSGFPYSGQELEQQGFPYSGQELPGFPYIGQEQQGFPQEQPGFPYNGQEQLGFPYSGQEQPCFPYSGQVQPSLLYSDQWEQTIPGTLFFGPQQQHPHEQFGTYNPYGSSPSVFPLPHAATTSFHHSSSSQNPHHLGSAPSGHAPMIPGYFPPPGMFPGYYCQPGPPMFRRYVCPPGPPVFQRYLRPPGPRMFRGDFRP
ncbi:hypothetical protein RYX36_016599 [Vicia faba]